MQIPNPGKVLCDKLSLHRDYDRQSLLFMINDRNVIILLCRHVFERLSGTPSYHWRNVDEDILGRGLHRIVDLTHKFEYNTPGVLGTDELLVSEVLEHGNLWAKRCMYEKIHDYDHKFIEMVLKQYPYMQGTCEFEDIMYLAKCQPRKCLRALKGTSLTNIFKAYSKIFMFGHAYPDSLVDPKRWIRLVQDKLDEPFMSDRLTDVAESCFEIRRSHPEQWEFYNFLWTHFRFQGLIHYALRLMNYEGTFLTQISRLIPWIKDNEQFAVDDGDLCKHVDYLLRYTTQSEEGNDLGTLDELRGVLKMARNYRNWYQNGQIEINGPMDGPIQFNSVRWNKLRDVVKKYQFEQHKRLLRLPEFDHEDLEAEKAVLARVGPFQLVPEHILEHISSFC
jgi:hypothetical protein